MCNRAFEGERVVERIALRGLLVYFLALHIQGLGCQGLVHAQVHLLPLRHLCLLLHQRAAVTQRGGAAILQRAALQIWDQRS